MLHPLTSKSKQVFLCGVVLGLSAMLATAAEVSGKVINRTTGTPSAGDEVVLADISADMKDAGRTHTDSSGRFHFRVAREGVPWLVTVVHTGVRYQGTVSAGKQAIEMRVFDKTTSTADVKSGVQVLQLDTDAGSLRATEMFTLINSSNPPRTIQNEELFSLPLPAGAELFSSLAEAPGESVVRSIAVAPPGENRCYFNFPLRPGTTKIQLQYQVPYAGSFTLTPYVPFPADMFGVVTPASVQFQPSEVGAYTRQLDGNGGIVELIRNAQKGSGPSFTILGSGAGHTGNSNGMAALQYGANVQQEALMTAVDSRTANAGKNLRPDYLLWSVLLAVVFIACSIVFVRQRTMRPASGAGPGDASTTEMIRERLFSLELDRLQNRISKSKYATARSLLEKRLAGALTKRTTP
jgi:hypothetical protein